MSVGMKYWIVCEPVTIMKLKTMSQVRQSVVHCLNDAQWPSCLVSVEPTSSAESRAAASHFSSSVSQGVLDG
jgi:hypothetical protein